MRTPVSPQPRRPWRNSTWEAVLFAAFIEMLILGAIFTSFPPGRPAGIAILVAVTAVTAWWTPVPAGAAVGALAWVFYLGFVVHTDATLGAPGESGAVALAVLVAAGVLAAGARQVRLALARYRRGPSPQSAIAPRSEGPITVVVVVIGENDLPSPTIDARAQALTASSPRALTAGERPAT